MKKSVPQILAEGKEKEESEDTDSGKKAVDESKPIRNKKAANMQ